jgi:hypothetical protein
MAAHRLRYAPHAASHGVEGNLAQTINADHSMGACQAAMSSASLLMVMLQSFPLCVAPDLSKALWPPKCTCANC